MDREDFMDIVYSELESDPDNNRANRIIEAADEYAESAQLGTNLAEVGTDLISRHAAIDAINEWLKMAKYPRNKSKYNQGEIDAYDTAIVTIKSLPPVTPKQPERCTDTLKAEIRRMKRSFTTCINSDYYTGYMSAPSAVEGYIAQLEGKE